MWGTFNLNFYKANKNGKKLSTKWGTIGKTKAFLIKGVSGEYLKVVYGGKIGYARSMTSAAKTMNSIFIDAGITTLASEWWHFQDQAGFEFNRDLTDNLSNWYPTSLAYK